MPRSRGRLWRPEVHVKSWPKDADGNPIPEKARRNIRGAMVYAIQEWFVNSSMSLNVRNAMHQAFIIGAECRREHVFCMKGTWANVKFQVTGRSARSKDKDNAHKKFLVKILDLQVTSSFDNPLLSWSWNHPAPASDSPWSDAHDSEDPPDHNIMYVSDEDPWDPPSGSRGGGEVVV